MWLTPFAKVYSIKAIKTLAKVIFDTFLYPPTCSLSPFRGLGAIFHSSHTFHHLPPLPPLPPVSPLPPLPPLLPLPSLPPLPHHSHRSHHLPPPPIIARAARTSHRSHLPFPSCPPSGVRRLVSNC